MVAEGVMRSEFQPKNGNGSSSSIQNLKSQVNFQRIVARLSHLSHDIASVASALKFIELSSQLPIESETDFYAEVRRFEISMIEMALERTGGSQIKAARLLRLKQTTLNSKI